MSHRYLPHRYLPRIVLGAAAVSTLASCVGHGAPTNGLAEVVNLSRSSASIHWQSPGLLGTPLFGGSGSESVGACGSYSRVFGAGDHTITIGSATTSRSFVLPAPEAAQPVLVIVIAADGAMTSVDRDHVPPSPYCR